MTPACATMKDISELDFRKGEILLINKPLGWSSFDVIRKLKRLLNAKTGYAGTLDPLASGLLIMATGPLTKKLAELQNLPKEYKGTIYVGASTPSYDRETEIDQRWDISHITEEDIQKAAKALSGTQEQLPPSYSAVKVDGIRSYKLARKGEAKELKPRTVEIYSFRIDNINLPLVDFTVYCSKGTYIRSLAHDFGRQLGIGACLYALTRTRVGDYSLEDAWELEDLIEQLNERREAERRDENI